MSKKKSMPNIYHGYALNGENAFMIAEFLESVVRMLWREYGDDMADFQGRVFPDQPPSFYAQIYCNTKVDDKTNF